MFLVGLLRASGGLLGHRALWVSLRSTNGGQRCRGKFLQGAFVLISVTGFFSPFSMVFLLSFHILESFKSFLGDFKCSSLEISDEMCPSNYFYFNWRERRKVLGSSH